MSVESYVVNRQEREISSCINDLKQVKRQLTAYKNALDQAWKSEEILHVNRAISSAISRIDEQIRAADALAGDIGSAAAQIRAQKELEKLKRENHKDWF